MHYPTLYDCGQISQAEFEDYSFERVMAWDTHPPTWRKLVMRIKVTGGVTSVDFCVLRMSVPGTVELHFKSSKLSEAIDSYNDVLLEQIRQHRAYLAHIASAK